MPTNKNNSFVIFLCVVCFLTNQCVHSSKFETDENGNIEVSHEMSLEELIDASIIGSNKTFDNVVDIIDYKQEWKKVGGILNKKINENIHSYKKPELVRAFKLYVRSNDENAAQLFKRLVRLKRDDVKKFAWGVAAQMHSENMRNEINVYINEILEAGELEANLFAETAYAIQVHGIYNLYSILSYGLMEKNDREFASAMASLDPIRSANDFLSYLGKADFLELRQIHFSSVDTTTCLFVLQHMLRYPPGIDHPSFAHLFFYGVSRNSSIAEIANEVLISYVAKHKELLAFTLATLPTEVQLAYVETSIKHQSAQRTLLLKTLKKMTSRPEVVDELNRLTFL